MKKHTCLMIGGSGMGGRWINHLATDFGDHVEFVGVADINPDALKTQGENLGLSSSQLFTDFNEACATVNADFCGIATPPEFHSPAAVAAMENGMPVLCEKPIADTLEAAKAMFHTSQKTGLPCVIIQNYRYHNNKQEIVRMREEERLGRLQHIVGRYACDHRRYLSWSKAWRHEMDFPLLFEGSVHHLDMLRFLSGGDCVTLKGFGWNPEWSSFKHYSSGFYLMQMDNGVYTSYEGNSSAAGITSTWNHEYYRLEFEQGVVEISGNSQITIHRVSGEMEVYDAPEIQYHAHHYIFNEFLDWLDGGEPSATRIQDNIKSFVLVIAAMETTVDAQPKHIADYLSDLEL